jgi:hypothetical protein
VKTPEEIALECMSPESVAGNVWNAVHDNFVAAIKQDRNNTLERAAVMYEKILPSIARDCRVLKGVIE